MSGLVRRRPLLFLFVGAAATAATLIWTWLAPLEWVAMVPLALVLLTCGPDRTVRLRKLYGYGLFYCFLFYCAVYHWFFYLYPLEFTGMSRGAAVAVVVLACFGLALLHGSIFALLFPLYGLLCRSPLAEKYPLLRLPLAAALWCVFEWMQTQTWIGVPWGRLPLGQVCWLPVIQTAELFGSYFITFVLMLVNLFLASAILQPKQAARRMTAALLVFGVNFAAGSLLYLADEGKSAGREGLTAAAVQGNISSNEKWGADSLPLTLERYSTLTLEAAANGAELIVWPESVIPYTLARYPWLCREIEELAEESGATLLIGTFTESEEGMLNSILAVTPDGKIAESGYSKRHLVPFGEYLPLEEFIETFIPPLAGLKMLSADLVPGSEAAVHELGRLRVGSLICFDSIYETLALESVREGANLIALSTNDSWFYDSAAVYQHNAQAILRAVETRRSIVRAANTGVSTIITPRGTESAFLPPLLEGQITAGVELNEDLTLYARIGNLFVWLCMAFSGVFFFSFLVYKKCRNGIDNQMNV